MASLQPPELNAKRLPLSPHNRRHPNTMPPPPPPSHSETTPGTSTDAPPMSDTDLSAIRARYLGVDKKKRKIRKMNDRKFVFDWDTQDDTAADMPMPLQWFKARVWLRSCSVADTSLEWMIITARGGRELNLSSQILWREGGLPRMVLTRDIGLTSHFTR
jgi:hypothetical protein